MIICHDFCRIENIKISPQVYRLSDKTSPPDSLGEEHYITEKLNSSFNNFLSFLSLFALHSFLYVKHDFIIDGKEY